jgi:hypothetical protein
MGNTAGKTALAIVITAIAGLGLLLTSSLRPAQSQSQNFTFALMGDLGYVPGEQTWTDNVFSDIARDTALSFLAHDGDLSSPRFACTDEMLQRRLGQFNAMPFPVIFTPGDNDWTDCHDAQGVKDGKPLERLAKVREIFFRGEESLGQRKMPLVRQSQIAEFSKYRENVRWDMGGIIFATLHVVGSNNGYGRTPETDAEFAERNKANMAWLQQAFAHAKSANSRAIMIVQQANMFHEWAPFPGNPQKNEGFVDLRNVLEKEVASFQKPVILVNGDSHYFRIDNPYRKSGQGGQRPLPSIENFLRVETFGSPNHHWVHVTVDPNDPNVFTFRPRIVSANVIKR